MRVGIYVSGLAGRPGFENLVSGHIQLPLQTVRLLRKAGVEVELITSAHSPGSTMPLMMPADVVVHEVSDGRVREIPDDAHAFEAGTAVTKPGRPTRGISPQGLTKQVRDIREICTTRGLDILHLFGHNRTGYLAGGLKMLGLPVPVVVTLVGISPLRRFGAPGLLLSKVDSLITSSEFGQTQLSEAGLSAVVLRHGPMRNILAELADRQPSRKTRVLFWRDPSRWNGADIALAAFRQVAPLYPQYTFEFALRPFYDEVDGIDAISSEHPNILVHRFPYKNGTTLAGLVSESLCAVMPFRTTSVDPQLALVETLDAGVPVITTSIRSNGEVVTDGQNGILVPPGDIPATVAALHRMLDDPQVALDMGLRAPLLLRTSWNWDEYPDRVLQVYGEALDWAR